MKLIHKYEPLSLDYLRKVQTNFSKEIDDLKLKKALNQKVGLPRFFVTFWIYYLVIFKQNKETKI